MNSCTDPSQNPSGQCPYNAFLEILRAQPLFAGVPLEAVKVLAYLCHGETFTQGDYLNRQDEHCECYRHLTRGRLIITRHQGNELVTVKELTEGDSYGGLGLILGCKSLFDIQALEETTTLTLTREKFQKTAQRFPQIEPALLSALAGHVLSWEERFIKHHPQEFNQLSRDFGLSLY